MHTYCLPEQQLSCKANIWEEIVKPCEKKNKQHLFRGNH